jgi:hypothetical protein
MSRKDAGASQQPWFDSTRSRRCHLPTAGSSATLPLLGLPLGCQLHSAGNVAQERSNGTVVQRASAVQH